MTVLAQTHIVSTPETMHGAPRIDGHRIRVQDVAVMHVRKGRTVEDIVAMYGLTHAEVYAALAYYYDHRDEMEAAIQADLDAIDEFREKYPSRLPQQGRG